MHMIEPDVAPDLSVRTASATPAAEPARSVRLHLDLDDPEIVAAVVEHPDGPARVQFVTTCLKIGVLSLRAARGLVDGEAIRREGDTLVRQLTERLTGYRTLLESNLASTLTHYFDPRSGLFSLRVENLVKDDGELASLIRAQVATVQHDLQGTLEKFIGENSAFLALLSPGESNQLLTAMRSTVDDVLQTERAAILGQFSLDDPTSALSRLVRDLTTTHGSLTDALATKMETMVGEFSLDRPDSALSRLVGRVEAAQKNITREFSLDNAESALSRLRHEIQTQLATLGEAQAAFQQQVVGLLSSMAARKEAESRSTTHGAVFEEEVGRELRAVAAPAGDVVEDCGTTPGQIPKCKVGDFVVTLSPDSAAPGARIAVEAKESGAYDLRKTLDEADVARRNRDAGVGLFVHSTQTAPTGLEPLARYGADIIVVWDPGDPSTDVVFRAGYLAAKALSLRAARRSQSEAASFQKIDQAIEVIRKQLEGFGEIKTSSETVGNAAKKILDRARIMSEEIEKQVAVLAEQVAAVKADDDGG
ncbi:MAG: hypothetical protein HY906_12150 [Deltaproteobacteria bacterium]|nr:hypothetical protein [Deltaproteobacteria bacterium]